MTRRSTSQSVQRTEPSEAWRARVFEIGLRAPKRQSSTESMEYYLHRLLLQMRLYWCPTSTSWVTKKDGVIICNVCGQSFRNKPKTHLYLHERQLFYCLFGPERFHQRYNQKMPSWEFTDDPPT